MVNTFANVYPTTRCRALNAHLVRLQGMTSLPLPYRTATHSLRYARARLYLGISGVGTAVVVATAMLIFDIPSRILSTSAQQPLVVAVTSVWLALLVSTVAFMFFDVIGGAMLVRHRVSVSAWYAGWIRGVAVQALVWLVTIAALLGAARLLGPIGAFGVFAALQLVLAATRGFMARIIAPMPDGIMPDVLRSAAQRAGIDLNQIDVVDTPDEGFVGGWTGIRARMLLVPLRWAQLPEPALIAALTRRRIIADTGAHLRGVLGAIAFNCVGFAAALLLPNAALSTAAGVLTVACAMTLWAFIGVLVLPTLSRATVFAIDRVAARPVGAESMRDAVTLLDRWQDDEPWRPRVIETIFHPVPARFTRLENLNVPISNAPVNILHAHQLARHALWLSWGSLTPISRAVHCNVGRPALWAMLPGD